MQTSEDECRIASQTSATLTVDAAEHGVNQTRSFYTRNSPKTASPRDNAIRSIALECYDKIYLVDAVGRSQVFGEARRLELQARRSRRLAFQQAVRSWEKMTPSAMAMCVLASAPGDNETRPRGVITRFRLRPPHPSPY